MAAKMKIVSTVLVVLLLLAVRPGWANTSAVFLGSFSNQKHSISEDPHIEGYSLALYREGEIVFGRFCWATGIEVPCAPIQDAVIDRTGNLKFKVKLSIGQEFSKESGPKGRPACRLIKFQGKIGENLIPGTVSISNIYKPKSPADIEKVKLKKVPYKGNLIQSYQEWIADPQNKPTD